MRRQICAMFAGALILGGCSDHDPPQPVPTSAPTSASSGATPPTMPAAALDDSHAGVTRFVRHYLDVLSYAALTGDVEELRRLSAPECTSCTTYIDLFADTYAAGGHFTGGEWSFKKAETRYGGVSYVTARVHTAAGTQKLTAADASTATSAKRTLLTFEVSPHQPRQIREITQGGFD